MDLAVTGVGSLAEAAAVLNDRNMAVKMMQEKENCGLYDRLCAKIQRISGFFPNCSDRKF